MDITKLTFIRDSILLTILTLVGSVFLIQLGIGIANGTVK